MHNGRRKFKCIEEVASEFWKTVNVFQSMLIFYFYFYFFPVTIQNSNGISFYSSSNGKIPSLEQVFLLEIQVIINVFLPDSKKYIQNMSRNNIDYSRTPKYRFGTPFNLARRRQSQFTCLQQLSNPRRYLVVKTVYHD